MSATRKPLVHWQPFWYLVLFAALFVTSSLQQAPAPVFLTAVAVTAAFALILVVAVIVAGRRPPGILDADGLLRSVEGVHLVVATTSTSARTPVAETARHQNSIALAYALGDDSTRAVLVPHATRWLGRRYRVAVQLIVGSRVFHAGFLGEPSRAVWEKRLSSLVDQDTYLAVPAVIVGSVRPFSVSIDLGALDEAIAQSKRSDDIQPEPEE